VLKRFVVAFIIFIFIIFIVVVIPGAFGLALLAASAYP